MSALELAAQFLSSTLGAFVSSLVIGIFGIYQWVLARREFGQVRDALDKANQALAKDADVPIAERFETLNEDLERIYIIGPLWQEFARAYIDVGDTDDGHAGPTSFLPASTHFTTETVINSTIRINWFSVVPNILTGCGLLGTFLGLAAGIFLASRGLTSDNLTEMLTALRQLLGGASTAFWTSIVGLIGSIFFTWRFRHDIRQLEKKLHKFCEQLENLFPVRSPEQILTMGYRELRTQTAALQRFNTDLAVTLGQAMDQAVSHRLTPALERLITAVEQIRLERQAANEQQLAALVQQFRQALMGSAGREMEALGQNLLALTAQLQQVTSAFASGEATIRQGMEEAIRSLQKGVAAVGQTLQAQSLGLHRDVAALLEQLKDRVASLQGELEAATAQFRTGVSRAAEDFSASLHGQLQQFGHAVHRLETLSNNWGEVLERGAASLESVFADVRSTQRDLAETARQLQAVHQQWRQLVASTQQAAQGVVAASHRLEEASQQNARLSQEIQQAVSALEQQVEELTEVWEAQKQRFADLDTALAKAFGSYQEGLESFGQTIKDYITNIDRSLHDATTHLAAAIAEMQEVLTDWQEEVTAALHGGLSYKPTERKRS